jgi:rRNA maturation protein Nop10
MANTELKYTATITCPKCGHQMSEKIPDNY